MIVSGYSGHGKTFLSPGNLQKSSLQTSGFRRLFSNGFHSSAWFVFDYLHTYQVVVFEPFP